MLQPFKNIMPSIHPSVFVPENAYIIGDVTIGPDVSVWYNTVIRGDVNTIRIGERTNIQDGSVLHVADPPCALNIGSDVTIGHGAIIHGCTISDCSMIGMGAVILNQAKIHSFTLVAAGALVRENAEFPEGVLVAGIPGKIIRELRPEERTMIRETAHHYVEYAHIYHATFRKA